MMSAIEILSFSKTKILRMRSISFGFISFCLRTTDRRSSTVEVELPIFDIDQNLLTRGP